MRQDYLDELGLGVPKGFDELKEFIHKATYNNPDGDGINNTIGTYIDLKYVIDIFNNHGSYVQFAEDRSHVCAIAFDREEGRIVDCMLSGKAMDPIIYIKSLYDDGSAAFISLSNSDFGSIGFFNTHRALNETSAVMTSYDGSYNNPVIINQWGEYIVIGSDNDDARTMVDKFLNTFFGEQKAYLSAVYGVEGEAFDARDGVTVIANLMGEKAVPHIVGHNPDMEEEISYSGAQPIWTHYERARILDELPSDLFLQNPRIGYGILQRKNRNEPQDLGGETLTGADATLWIFDDVYDRMIRGDISIVDGFDRYKRIADLLEFEQFIDDLNEKIGR